MIDRAVRAWKGLKRGRGTGEKPRRHCSDRRRVAGVAASIAFDSPAGAPAQWGYGDTEIAFKYRFVNEDENGLRPMVGVFPTVEVPTGDQSLGLGAGHVGVFLPVWLQKSLGDGWLTYGGGGYWINNDASVGDKN